MPWKDKTVKELRAEFIAAVKTEKNMSRVCREFGISRPTGYKWLARAEQGEELDDKSHAPRQASGKTAREIEDMILRVRAENPEWGGKTILRVLENEGQIDLPCVKTANNILKRNGCVDEAESQKHQAFQRFQREHCNELWQTDFKGDFQLGDGKRCYPLTILDDCSRYSVAIFNKTDTRGVRESFETAFREHGMPQAVLSDNGAQFSGFRGGYTHFERWLMELDIRPLHGRIMHPQTQGKIERFHRTMKNECLKYNDFTDLSDADRVIQAWREKYNCQRPHEALGLRCPADVYIPSTRKYPEHIAAYEYSGIYRVVKVNNWGYLRFDTVQVFLSETMADTRLEIRPTGNDTFAVYFRNFQIAEVDAVTQRLVNRRISRRSSTSHASANV